MCVSACEGIIRARAVCVCAETCVLGKSRARPDVLHTALAWRSCKLRLCSVGACGGVCFNPCAVEIFGGRR
eukprot:1265533-Pleurochrysis_carterae.AAC.1